MLTSEQHDQFRNKLLALLRKINRSAQHYWVNPPEEHDKKWRAGWCDNLLKPKVWFCETAQEPTELIQKLEKAIISKG